jgi:hypothetical protein
LIIDTPWQLKELKAKITAAVESIARDPLATIMENTRIPINGNGYVVPQIHYAFTRLKSAVLY